jgi:multimeric flavodoxin WrbA
LLKRALDAFRKRLKQRFAVRANWVDLNELEMLTCQACGEAPTPKFCFFDDDLSPVYDELARADAVLFGSPIHFDSVSSVAKIFIDRCNCVRPADFNDTDPDHDFLKLIRNKRPGGMVLVGGKHGWFEGARRVIAGFFKWVEVTNEGLVSYHSEDFNRAGTVADDKEALDDAEALGRKLADRIRRKARD